MYPILRLPRTFGSRNDKPRINEIAIGLRNDNSFFVIASEAKQSINNSRLMQKQKRKKNSLPFVSFVIAKAKGLWQSINHKTTTKKTENKKKSPSMQKQKIKKNSLLFIKLKN